MKIIMSVVVVFLLVTASFSQQSGDTPISAIQGEGQISPLADKQVSTVGVVTALVKKGFYIQTPDAAVDKNPKTSEGVYVFTNDALPSDIAVGNLVRVTGTVTEFRSRTARFTLPATQITRPRVETISKGNPLPSPALLTAAEIDAKGRIDQMERYEGMRVKVDSLTVTAGTSGRIDDKKGIAFPDGIFYGVVTGTPRPMREAGIEIITAAGEKLSPNIVTFDMNPENLRFDGNGQLDTKQIHVTAGATLKNVTGVVDYTNYGYTILLDAGNRPAIEGNKSATPAAAAKEREVTVGSFNIENFFDDEVNSPNVDKEAITPKEVFAGRLNKASLAIRNVLLMPDVLGIVECENLKVLQKLADKINADAVADKQPNPNYVAYLEEGNDIRGIDVGFLVKSNKVKVVEVKQLGKDVKLDTDGAKGEEKLFDRPPLLLSAEVADAKTGKPFAFTTIVVHLKSYGGIDDAKDGPRVQNKRRLQAEWLAQFVVDRAKTSPAERLLLCGDFNAFQFPDGYNDLIGTLKGKPSPNVLTPGTLHLATELKDLVDYLPADQRYSFVYGGNAQVLDHMLVNKPAAARVLRFGFARVDADFPLLYYNNYTRPERLSDHDAPIVYLGMDEKKPQTK